MPFVAMGGTPSAPNHSALEQPMPTSRLASAAALLAATLAACGGSGIEGTYYNEQTGARAFELKGGKVLDPQGMMGQELVYKVKGDSLYLATTGADAQIMMSFGIKPGGVLDLGILGSLKKR
jgi:hypothetical protein